MPGLVPGIHVFLSLEAKTWMAGTKPGHDEFDDVVPANAGTHTARTLVSALQQRPFFTFEARGYGSLRSQGRPA